MEETFFLNSVSKPKGKECQIVQNFYILITLSIEVSDVLFGLDTVSKNIKPL